MKTYFSFLVAIIVALPAQATSPSSVSSSRTVSESDHERFEKKYSELCVKGQQKNPDSPIRESQELDKMCSCMAKEVSKRLSKAEAVHFLDKNEVPIDLVMMGNAASDICTLSPH